MADDTTVEETLMRLAQSGVATHVLSFETALADAASLDDEVQALEALSALTPGPIYRVAPLRYAFEWREDADALAAQLAETLGLETPPAIAALPDAAPPADAPRAASDALRMLGAFGAPAGDSGRMVIDAAQAVAAAETTARRIDDLMAELAARLPAPTEAPETIGPRLEAIEAALREPRAAADPDLAARLERIEAALATGTPDGAGPDGAALETRLAAIEAALAAPREADPRLDAIADAVAALTTPAADPEVPARLEAIETALRARSEAAAPDPALTERLAAIEAKLDRPAEADPRLDAIADAVAALQTPHPVDPALTDRLAAIEAALAAPREPDPRLDAIADAVAGLQTPAPADPALTDRLAAIEAALAAPREPDPALETMAEDIRLLAARPVAGIDLQREREGLTRLSSALQTLLSRMDAGATRLMEARDAAVDLTPLTERLDALAEAQTASADAQAAAADALAARLEALEHAAARRPEPDMAPALDPVLARLETMAAAQDAALAGFAARLDALEGAAAPDATADLADIVERLREIADRPVANVDFRREREALTRLSSALQTMLTRLDAAARGGADVGAMAERLGEIESQIAALALNIDGGLSEAALEQIRTVTANGGGDLKRERETLTRLSFSLQTVASRLEAEVARLMDAGETGVLDEAALAGVVEQAVAPLGDLMARVGDRLEGLESTGGLTADHAASLVEMVQRVREECAELHGLHGRYIEAQGADAAEALMDRVTATMAEFLARLERAEAQRGTVAAASPPRGLAPRLGRAS